MEYKNRGKKRQVKGSWRVASKNFHEHSEEQRSSNTRIIRLAAKKKIRRRKKRKRKKEEKNVKCHQAFKGPAIWKLVSKERFLVERRKRRLVISMVAFYSSRGGGESMNRSSRERERNQKHALYFSLAFNRDLWKIVKDCLPLCSRTRKMRYLAITCLDFISEWRSHSKPPKCRLVKGIKSIRGSR